jgi:hypothetical protein
MKDRLDIFIKLYYNIMGRYIYYTDRENGHRASPIDIFKKIWYNIYIIKKEVWEHVQ